VFPKHKVTSLPATLPSEATVNVPISAAQSQLAGDTIAWSTKHATSSEKVIVTVAGEPSASA